MRVPLAGVLLFLGTGMTFDAPVPKMSVDPLPDGAFIRLGSARFRGLNTDGVTFSPDGKRAVVGSRDGTALIWDLSK